MMTEDDRNARVVITADTKQYQQNVKAASVETSKLEQSIDKLTQKLDGLLKRTGKKMMLLGAADIAALTAASQVAATLEKQMSDMEAAAVNMKGALDMSSVKDNIRALSREFPLARSEIVQLETAITNMGLSATQQVNSMTKAFIQLGGATGESNVALAQGQIGLSRQMGTLSSNPQTLNRQNDATTVLSAQGGVSATDMLNFSQSIAPVAAMSGMTENQVKGVSTAFLRAGANGTYASNVFAKLANDLVRMQQTGSPDIQRYANVLGVSQKEISGMNPVDILDRLTKQTASGGNMRTLDYLGFDSIRAQKALQGVAAEGGVQKWIDVANEASSNNKNETQQAAEVAFTGFLDSMTTLRNRFTDIIQAIGDPILKPLTMLANALNTLMAATQPLIDIFSKVAGIGGGIGGVGLLGGGMALRTWAGISTPALIKRAGSSTFGEAVRFGLSHGSMRAGGLTPDDAVAARMMPGAANGFGWFNRGVYGAMGHIGGLFPGTYDPSGKRVGFGNPFRTAINMGLMGAGSVVNGDGLLGMRGMADQYSKASLASGYERIGYEGRGRGFWSSFGASLKNGPVHEVFGDKPVAAPSSNIAEAKANAGPIEQMRMKFAQIMAQLKTAVDTATASLVRFAKTLNATAGAKVSDLANNSSSKSVQVFAKSLQDGTGVVVLHNKTLAQHIGVVAAETKTRVSANRELAASTPVWKMLRKQMTETGASFYELMLAATRTARGMAGTAAGGLVRGGGNAMGSLVGMLGMHPGVALALAGVYAGATAYSGNQDLEKRLSDIGAKAVESSNGLRVYNEALGLSTEALIGFTGALKQAPSNAKQALDPKTLRSEAIANPTYTNQAVSTMDAGQAINWIRSLGPMTPEQLRAVGTDVVRRFGGSESSPVLAALRDQGKGQKAYNTGGYENSFSKVAGLNEATDFEGVGWWDNMVLANGGITNQGYLDKLLADGSPIRNITDSAFQQAAGNIDYVASNLTTGKGEKADSRMNMATAMNEYASVVAGSLKGVVNNSGSKSDKENASAIASATKALQLLGVNPDDINQKVEDLGIKGMDFSGQSEAQRKEWVWKNLIAPNVTEASSFSGIGEVESTAGGPATSKRQYTAQAEETMKSISGVNKVFTSFTKQWGNNKVFANAAMQPEDPKLGAKSIEMLKKIADNTSGNFGEAEAKLRTLGAYDITMQPFTDAAIAENRAKRSRELTGANQAEQGRASLEDLQGAITGFTNKPESYAALKEAKAGSEDWIAAWYAKLKDYHKMMQREEVDYETSMRRTEADHNRQLMFSREDFYRSQRFQKRDFHRSMLRQEKDYQLQLKRMVEDYSRTAYDPFQRIMSQGSRSGASMVYNLREQNEMMKKQREGIDKLKRMGMSQAAIDDLSLMDPSKAQQVAYWADGGINRRQVRQTNREVAKRRDLGESMVKSEDSQGFRRQEEDRKRAINRAVEDFHRGLRRSTQEFLRQMHRGQEDYERSLRRMDADREKNLERAKKDLLGFMKDSQKTVDQQAAYVTKILGRMHNKVGDAMISIVDRMIVAIHKAEALTATGGNDKKKKGPPAGSIPSIFGDLAIPSAPTVDDLSGVKDQTKYRGGTNRDTGLYYHRDVERYHSNTYGGSTNRSGARRHAEGGIALSTQYGIVGEGGPEAIIPLNSKGARFMADALAMMHTSGKNMSVGEARQAMQVYNNSTNFNGEIRVEAQDPDEMVRKLKHRARMDSLRGGKGTPVYS